MMQDLFEQSIPPKKFRKKMQDTLGEGEFGKVVLASLNNFKGKPGESVKFDFLDFYML